MFDMNKFGYPTQEPCSVCGKANNNQIEPRFLYVVCVDHQHVSPVVISHKTHKDQTT